MYCLMVVALAATCNAQTSVTVIWTAPGDDGDVGTADRYEMVFSTDSTDLYAQVGDFKSCPSCVLVSGLPRPLVAGTVQEAVISGVSPNTDYWVAMRAGDEVPNWSGISNIIKVHISKDVTAPSMIIDFRIKP